jgi:hypothetical protein
MRFILEQDKRLVLYGFCVQMVSGLLMIHVTKAAKGQFPRAPYHKRNMDVTQTLLTHREQQDTFEKI